jgi:3-dehydroquinate dehydratase/shikimate dehydrogenase
VTSRAAATDGWLTGLPAGVSDVEIRADLAGDVDPEPLRRCVPGRLIYSLRSTAHGGHGPEGPEHRYRRLVAAARDYDLVDLDADHDLVPALLARIPPEQRRIAWRGPPQSLPDLRARFDRLAAVPAELYLLAPAAGTAEQALAPLRLLADLGRADVTAFGTGPAGLWSRLLAPWLGAPVIFGQLGSIEGSGMPAVDRLLADYPFPDLPPLRAIYGIAGPRAGHSHSPRLHNAAYARLGLPALFLPLPTDDLAAFWPEVAASGLAELGLPIRGLTVAAPNKEAALALAATSSRVAQVTNSANIMVHRGGGWWADTTDGTAVLAALRQTGFSVPGARVAVVGCGGAGRAAAFALSRQGAEVTLVNRGLDRGQQAAQMLGLHAVPLDSFDPAGYSVVVNATPVYDHPLFAVEDLTDEAIVLDFVYSTEETALVAGARKRGLSTIDGWEVLRQEVMRQFYLMTGETMPDVESDGFHSTKDHE